MHGWRSRASRFADLVPRLRALGLTAVGYDAPGHGDSGGRTATVLDHRAVALRLQERYGDFEAVVAHSLGVNAAFLALREGLRAERLVAFSGASELSWLPTAFCERLGLNATVERELRRREASGAMFPGVADIRTHFDAARDPGEIALPILVAHDEDDDVVPFSHAHAAPGGVRGAAGTTGHPGPRPPPDPRRADRAGPGDGLPGRRDGPRPSGRGRTGEGGGSGMKLLELHTRALELAASVVDAVQPEQLVLATPCAGWPLRRLLEHEVGQHRGFAAAALGAGADRAHWRDVPVHGDPAGAFRRSAERLTAAFATADAAAEPALLTLPEIGDGGPFPLDRAIGFHLLDTLVHAWDVAAALGSCGPAGGGGAGRTAAGRGAAHGGRGGPGRRRGAGARAGVRRRPGGAGRDRAVRPRARPAGPRPVLVRGRPACSEGCGLVHRCSTSGRRAARPGSAVRRSGTAGWRSEIRSSRPTAR